MAWGRPRSCDCGSCEKCRHTDYMRRWYASKTPEERREMLKQRNSERVKRQERERYETQRKHDPVYRAKERARQTLRRAVRRGDVVKLPCEVCGLEEAQAHHDDYAKPLDVRWLCSTHHGEVHRLDEAA